MYPYWLMCQELGKEGHLLDWLCMLVPKLIQIRPQAICACWSQHASLVQRGYACIPAPQTLCTTCSAHGTRSNWQRKPWSRLACAAFSTGLDWSYLLHAAHEAGMGNVLLAVPHQPGPACWLQYMVPICLADQLSNSHLFWHGYHMQCMP